MTTDPNRRVQATTTTLRIVEALDELEGAGVTELADHLNASKGAVHRHLTTLCDAGYAVQIGDEYDLGLAFLSLGTRVQRRRELYQLGSTHLGTITSMITGTAAIVVEENGEAVYLLVVGAEESDLEVHEGERFELDETALGVLVLAHNSNEEEASSTTIEPFKSNLGTGPNRDLVLDQATVDPDRRSVAAPIVVPDDRIVGAVEIICDADEVSPRRLENEAGRLVDVTAQRISKQYRLLR